MDQGGGLILPIWHNISRSEIVRESPPLADVIAIKSDHGLTAVCNQLLRKIRPDESPLIAARDELIAWGFQPPVISDEWWLDVVEASNRVPFGGAAIPEISTWGSWSFPLPQGKVGAARGLRLAWAAMQLRWTTYAEQHRICQITRPETVHSFLRDMPGLYESCLDAPEILANYAPQLTLREFSGDFGSALDELLANSEATFKSRRERGDQGGIALTIDTHAPLCDETVALRHDTFGNYEAPYVAQFFVRGDMWGPTYDLFERFDYLVWLLSYDSNWLPEKPRQFLIQGLCDSSSIFSPRTDNLNNPFFDGLWRTQGAKSFRWTKLRKDAWNELVSRALETLGVEDSAARIGAAILERGIVERYFQRRPNAARGGTSKNRAD